VTSVAESLVRLLYAGHQRDGAGSPHERRWPDQGGIRWACGCRTPCWLTRCWTRCCGCRPGPARRRADAADAAL